MGVLSYAPNQVTPSGSFAPIVVTVPNGSNAEQDILMLQAEIAHPHPGSGSTYANPAALPQGGAWGSWTSGYGSADFFQFTAQANRTASVAVTALDEAGQPTETKLLPVIGIWELSDESGDPAPAATTSAFNSETFAMTRLDAQFNVSEAFRVGVADFRGDGRPDYFYQANLLYSDSLTPARLSLAGGVTTLNGIGFSPGLQWRLAATTATRFPLRQVRSRCHCLLQPQDGMATIQVTNPVTGAFSQMIGALTYGASATDLLLLLQGAEPSTPVGAQAANPIRVRAVAADGVTPVSGATIAWSTTNGVEFSACNGASSCSVLSDEAGEASSLVTPTATGQSTITIALAPASYSPPQQQQATLVATSTTLDVAAVTPTHWIGQGATLAVPLTVEALDLGNPLPNVTINFVVTQGTTSLSAASATTNGAGFASVTANLTNLSVNVQVSACVAPSNSQCTQPFVLNATPASLLDTANRERIVAGHAHRPGISTSGDARHRRLERRKSRDGSQRRFRHHAGAGQWRRAARPSRIVAIAGGDRPRRHGVHRALHRKRWPVLGIHHGECRPIDRAVADAEPGSHRSGATAKHAREGCAGRERTAHWVRPATPHSTRVADRGGRYAAKHCER
jgi:hypothetical protein